MCCVQLRKRSKSRWLWKMGVKERLEQGQVRDENPCGELCGVGYREHNKGE